MLITDDILGYKDQLLALTLFALKKECVKGFDAEKEWNLAFALEATIELAELDLTDQSLEDKLDCLVSMMPPKCLPIPTFFTTTTALETCEMSVVLDIDMEVTGNPCENFTVSLAVY